LRVAEICMALSLGCRSVAPPDETPDKPHAGVDSAPLPARAGLQHIELARSSQRVPIGRRASPQKQTHGWSATS
jgi:hypothetical protein